MSFERRDTVADFISGYATDQTAAALEQRAREQVRLISNRGRKKDN